MATSSSVELELVLVEVCKLSCLLLLRLPLAEEEEPSNASRRFCIVSIAAGERDDVALGQSRTLARAVASARMLLLSVSHSFSMLSTSDSASFVTTTFASAASCVCLCGLVHEHRPHGVEEQRVAAGSSTYDGLGMRIEQPDEALERLMAYQLVVVKEDRLDRDVE